MKIFTVFESSVLPHAVVSSLTLASGTKVPAILVGEDGRGRRLGVLPVSLLPKSQAMWDYGKSVRIENVRIGETRSGKPKLIEIEPDGSDDYAVVVMPTPIGFRGSNSHGSRIMWEIDEGYHRMKGRFISDLIKDPEAELVLQKYKEKNSYASYTSVEEFVKAKAYTTVEGDLAGEILASGEIAQGMAGRAGSGEQFIVLMPKGATWAVKMTGRLYGKPSAYEYVFCGEKITAYTARDLELIE